MDKKDEIRPVGRPVGDAQLDLVLGTRGLGIAWRQEARNRRCNSGSNHNDHYAST